MIFKPILARQIVRGEKTQTRRPVKAKETDEFGITRCRYQPGRSYSVQPGRGKPGEFRIRVTALTRESVGALTLEDARAEGFRTTHEFKAYWLGLYEPGFMLPNDDACVACASPGLTRDGYCTTCGVDDQANARATLIDDCFNARHASTEVWAISFVVDQTDRPRLLASTSRSMGPKVKEGDNPALAERDQYRGYTSSVVSALPDEPEAVDADAQKTITAEAGRTLEHWQALDVAHRDQHLRMLSVEQRMTAAHTAAHLGRVSISRELHLVRTRLKQGAGHGSVVKLLERAERKAYNAAA